MPNLTRPGRARFLMEISGGSAVELALIAPILIVLLLGAIDFSLWISSRMQVAAAARAGAAYAAAHGYDATQVATAITNATSLSGISASPAPVQSCGCPDAATGVVSAACGAACPAGGTAGSYVTVSATANYSTILSWPGIASPVTLTSNAKVRVN